MRNVKSINKRDLIVRSQKWITSSKYVSNVNKAKLKLLSFIWNLHPTLLILFKKYFSLIKQMITCFLPLLASFPLSPLSMGYSTFTLLRNDFYFGIDFEIMHAQTFLIQASLYLRTLFFLIEHVHPTHTHTHTYRLST